MDLLDVFGVWWAGRANGEPKSSGPSCIHAAGIGPKPCADTAELPTPDEHLVRRRLPVHGAIFRQRPPALWRVDLQVKVESIFRRQFLARGPSRRHLPGSGCSVRPESTADPPWSPARTGSTSSVMPAHRLSSSSGPDADRPVDPLELPAVKGRRAGRLHLQMDGVIRPPLPGWPPLPCRPPCHLARLRSLFRRSRRSWPPACRSSSSVTIEQCRTRGLASSGADRAKRLANQVLVSSRPRAGDDVQLPGPIWRLAGTRLGGAQAADHEVSQGWLHPRVRRAWLKSVRPEIGLPARLVIESRRCPRVVEAGVGRADTRGIVACQRLRSARCPPTANLSSKPRTTKVGRAMR